MEASTIWWLAAGAVVVAELLTGTFYLLMVAVGLSASALAAHLGLPIAAQLVAAALVGGGAAASDIEIAAIGKSAKPMLPRGCRYVVRSS